MNSLTNKPIVKKAMLFTIMLSLITSMFVGLPNSEVAAYTKTVKLEPSTMDRTWDGWGTALAWFGHATGGWKTEQRDKLVDALYSEEGLNYNIARYNIGGGDDPTHDHMRKGGDIPGFSTGFGEDGKMEFDFTADANQRWWLQEAKKRWEQRDETFITEAFSNSPPYFMTISGCTAGHWDGGTSNLDPSRYPDFAEYLATVVEHYKEEHGITFDTLSVVNEPTADYWSANNGREGSYWEPWQQSWVIYEAYQALVAKGLAGEGVADEDEVKIAAMDESIIDTFLTNWAEYGQDTKDIVSQFNVHAYGGDKRQEVRDLARQENKKLWMSQADVGPSDVPHNHEDMEPGLSLAWQIMTDVRWFEPEAWVLWQAVEEEHNMREDKENMNWGLIHADFDTEEWWYTKKYYAMGQFSKFIPQGSKFFQNDDWDEQYTLTAYNEKDNETVIVYRNPDDEAVQVTFDLSEFATPGKAVKTYVTSEDKNLAEGQTAVIGNKLFAEVEGKSITTFIIEGAAYKEGETSTIAGMLEALQADLASYEGAGREDVAFFTAQITTALEADDEVQQATLENVSKAFFELKAGKIPQSTMNVLASSEEIAGSNEGAANAIDGDMSSIWHTNWGDSSLPATMEFDFDWNRDGIYKLEYVPRQDDSSNGVATAYEVHVADSTEDYKLVAKGEWAANKDVKIVAFNAVNATKLKLVITGSQDGSYASAAEINVYRSPSFTVNTSELQVAIEEANEIIAQAESETDYVNLREVVSLAEVLLQSTTATQEAIDQMVVDIRLVLSTVNELKVEIAYAPQAHYSTPIENMIDGDIWTMYESNWESSGEGFEEGDYIVLDLGKAHENVEQIVYSPRLNGEYYEVENGRMKQYKIFTSDQDLNSIKLNGSAEQLAKHFKLAGFGDMDVTNGSTQTITFEPQRARYVAIQVLKTGGDGSTLSIGELVVRKKIELNEFTVIFDSTGGSNVAQIKDVEKGSTIEAPTAPTKKGYTFLGWYTAAVDGEKWDFAVNKVNRTLRLYAQWNKVENLLKNAGFEHNTSNNELADHWNANINDVQARAENKIVTTPIYRGKKAQQISVSNLAKNKSSKIEQSIHVNPNEEFVMEAKINIPELHQAKAMFHVMFLNKEGEYLNEFQSELITTTNGFETLQIHETIPPEAREAIINVSVYALANEASGTIIVDDVSFQYGNTVAEGLETPTDLEVIKTRSKSVLVSWTDDQNSSDVVSHYEIVVNDIVHGTTTDTIYKITNLKPAQQYEVEIIAVGTSEERSDSLRDIVFTYGANVIKNHSFENNLTGLAEEWINNATSVANTQFLSEQLIVKNGAQAQRIEADNLSTQNSISIEQTINAMDAKPYTWGGNIFIEQLENAEVNIVLSYYSENDIKLGEDKVTFTAATNKFESFEKDGIVPAGTKKAIVKIAMLGNADTLSGRGNIIMDSLIFKHKNRANYTYNALNQLKQVSYVDGTTITYTYDDNGNKINTVLSDQ
ncbi:discoidin domain-containing protein [Paenibacillus yanchengensis]|uniref:Discoidin domain-containing protein n=1 Tax=Paenibacillus yanchengensis TaxID=2035833 RepID=A0ABW4YHF0_9BACL